MWKLPGMSDSAGEAKGLVVYRWHYVWLLYSEYLLNWDMLNQEYWWGSIIILITTIIIIMSLD